MWIRLFCCLKSAFSGPWFDTRIINAIAFRYPFGICNDSRKINIRTSLNLHEIFVKLRYWQEICVGTPSNPG